MAGKGRTAVRPASPSETSRAPEPVAPLETWVWKIATAPPQITYIDLTPEVLREALMEVVGG